MSTTRVTRSPRRQLDDQGQGYLGLLAAVVLVGVLTFLEFGGGGSSGAGGSGGVAGSGGTGANGVSGSVGGGGYGATIGAAKSAAAEAGKPDAYSGANSGLLPTTTVVTDPPVSYAPAAKGPGALTKSSIVSLADKVVSLAESLAGPNTVVANDPSVGKSYLSVAFADVASSAGATLVPAGSGWNVVSGDGKWTACIAVSGSAATVHGGRCS